MFKRRFMQELKTKYLYWKSLIDWVMLLYMTVPTSLFGYYFLRETVFQAKYGLLEFLPSYLVVAVLIFCTGLLSHRYFVEAADKLFLIQYSKKLSRLKLHAFLFTFFKNTLLMGLLFSLLIPYFTLVNDYANWQLIQIIVVLLLGLLLSEIVKYRQKAYQKFLATVLILASLTLSVFTNKIIIFPSIVLLVVVALYFFSQYIYSNSHFEKQVELDFEASRRIQSIMIKMNPQFRGIKQEIFKKRKPLWWRKLYAKSPTGAIRELILKTVWRRSKLREQYSLFTGLLFVLLGIFPIWLNIVLIIVYWIGMKQYIESIVLEFKDSMFAQIHQVNSSIYQRSIRLITRDLVILPIFLYTTIIILKFIL